MAKLSRPLVSVLIPSFNAEGFLGRAVASALDQTLSAELVIVDDASTDGALALARSLAAGRDDVRVEALACNGGPAVARNTAIAAARGDWLAVLDADDAYAPDHLRGLHELGEDRGADIVLSNFRYFDPAGRWEGGPALPVDGGPIEADRYGYVEHARPYGSTPDWGLLKPMFRSSFLQRQGLRYPTHSRHGEDFLLMFEALLQGAKVVISRAPSYLYTHRGSGWSRTRVDYEAQIAQTAALIDDPRVRQDGRLIALLKARIKAIGRLAAEHRVRALWESRSLGRLLLGSLVDHRVGATTARFAGAKLMTALR